MRLSGWVISIVMVVWWLWPSGAKPLDLDAGTFYEGFAMLDREAGHLTEVTQNGRVVRELDLPSVAKDARVVGTRSSTGLVWLDGKRVAFAPVDQPDEKELFGKRADKLCTQTATTHMEFAVAWLERDGAIWILRGGTHVTRATDATDAATVAEAPYCGIANAADGVALLYRNGNRTELVRCPHEKRCGNPRRVALDGRESILGFGCTWHFCMVATRARSGTTTLHWLDDKAKTIAKREIDAGKDGAVNVAGEGERFAIAYSNGLDPIVEFADAPGQLRQIYAGGDSNTTPSLAWMGNVLLIAAQRDGKLVWETIIL